MNPQPVNLTSVNPQPVNLTSVSSDVVCLQPQPVGSMSHIDNDFQDRTAKWSGFKLVGDNIDKNFRRSFYRHNRQTISMHAFHTYAVKDRIDLSSLSDAPPSGAKVDIAKLLICQADIDGLNKDVTTLLSR